MRKIWHEQSSLWRWIVFSAIVAIVLFVPVPAAATTPGERTFRIEASRFQYSPAVLKVNPGDRVTIELVAQDVVHGLSIDGYNLAVTADPGQTARLSFIADRPGSFHFRCSVTCGNLHPFMNGKIEVGPNILLYRAIASALVTLVAGVARLWK